MLAEHFGKPAIAFHWGQVIPAALIVGLSYAILMAHPPFGNYD
jgi:hypothetical protein